MRVDRRRTRRRRRRTCGWGVTHRKCRAIHVVCVCLCRRRRRRRSSSSSSSSAVSLAALAAPLVRMKSSAVQVPAAVSCSSAVPTEHHRQHTRCAPPTHPQRDRPRGGVVDGSPSAQRTSSTVRLGRISDQRFCRFAMTRAAGSWENLPCSTVIYNERVPQGC